MIINRLLVEEIFNQPLCIDNKYAQGLALSAYSMIMGGKMGMGSGAVDFGVAAAAMSIAEPLCAFVPGSATKQTKEFKPGSVSVITLDGPVVQNSDPYYGIKGTLELGQEFLQADADPNIIAHVFANNSGGGAVYAIKPLDDIMAGLKKPVVNFSKQIVASAAYRLAARSKYIMMYHPMGIAGSLGTMSSFSDMQPMFEKWGMKFHEFYATLSTLKNQTYIQAREGDGKALIEKVLDPMNENFLAEIRELRGDKIDSKDKTIFQGETYLATNAITLGLIDGLGNLSDAIALAAQFAQGKPAPKSVSQINNSNMNFPQLQSLKGKKTPTQEELDAANAELTEAGITGVGLYPESVVTDAAAVTTERDSLKTQLNTANESLTAANGQVSTLTTENAGLKAKIAKAPAAAAPAAAAADPVTEKTEAEKKDEEVQGFAHNEYVKQNFPHLIKK